MGLPNYKQIAPANSPSPPSPPNCKRTAPPNNLGFFHFSNHKWTAVPDSANTTRIGSACTNKSLLLVKKQKYFNVFLLPNYIEWPTLNQL